MYDNKGWSNRNTLLTQLNMLTEAMKFIVALIFCIREAGRILSMCLDGGFRREREVRVHFSFLNYRHYEMFFKNLTN